MTENGEFKGYARVEIMGRAQHIGYCQTEAFGGTVLFRVDQPEIPAVEETLARPEWIGDTRCPAGTVVSRGAIPGVSVLIGAGSIYRIIPCDEATALAAIRTSQHRPLMIVKLAPPELLEAGARPPERDLFYDGDDDDVSDGGEA